MSQIQSDSFRMHIMHLDYYFSPMKVLGTETIVDGPVIRIFGCLDRAERVPAVCHIHQVFPYFYFRPENVRDTTFSSLEQVKTYLPSFQKKLEAALKSAGKPSIVRLEAVLKKTLYGYFRNEMVFVKVDLYNPLKVKHLVAGLEVRGLSIWCE